MCLVLFLIWCTLLSPSFASYLCLSIRIFEWIWTNDETNGQIKISKRGSVVRVCLFLIANEEKNFVIIYFEQMSFCLFWKFCFDCIHSSVNIWWDIYASNVFVYNQKCILKSLLNNVNESVFSLFFYLGCFKPSTTVQKKN